MGMEPRDRRSEQPPALADGWMRSETTDQRALVAATGAALLLHLGLLMAQLPERPRPARPEPTRDEVAMTIRWQDPPPPARELPRAEPPPVARRIPRPDPTPDEPEPPITTIEPPPLAPVALAPLPAPAPGPVAVPVVAAPEPAQEPGEPAPIRVKPGQGPRVIHRVDPLYPAVARLTRREGTVELDAVILKSGRVAEITVLRSAGPALDRAALEALRKWRFSSGDHDVVMVLTVHFRVQ